MTQIVELDPRTKLLRQWMHRRLDEGADMLTYADAAAAIGEDPASDAFRQRMARCCEWIERQRSNTAFKCHANVGYALVPPGEAGLLVRGKRETSGRIMRKVLRRTYRLVRGAPMSEEDGRRFFLEAMMAGAMVEAASERSINRLEQHKPEGILDPGEVYRLLGR